MKKIRVALIGSGFVAEIHADALQKVYGVDIELAACASPRRAGDFAARHRIPEAVADYREILQNPEIDVVDICTPNQLHKSMVIEAALAGKHIICEKPLTGYFGAPSNHPEMLQAVRQDLSEIRETIAKAGVGFAYAENWVYAPAIIKAKRVLATTGGTILSQRAEESHSGSHAAYATEWSKAGGGSLLRLGAHPVGSVIHMKHHEGSLKGKSIQVQSVTGETARLIDLPGIAAEANWFKFKPQDVEDWASAMLTFSDGTKALVVSSDTILGGVRNTHDLFMSRGVIQCNMNPSNTLMLYTPDSNLLGDEYVAEKVETKGGWQYAAPDEDWVRGYHHEMQDFMESFSQGREPVSGLKLACETVETIYAIYLSANLGKRIDL